VTNRGLTIYGDSGSGNCHKVRFVAEQLQMPFRWVETSALSGDTRQPAFLAINPAGQVPTVTLPDGRHLAQSNAIMLFLAEGSRLIPTDSYERANMNKWLFWEQNNHEPWIAVRRKLKKMLGKSDDQIDPNLMANGIRALSIMNEHLATRLYFVSDRLTLADIALIAYTRFADEGGFNLADFPAVRAWVGRIEADLGLRR
jgi:glutathione S-transferase